MCQLERQPWPPASADCDMQCQPNQSYPFSEGLPSKTVNRTLTELASILRAAKCDSLYKDVVIRLQISPVLPQCFLFIQRCL